MLRRQFEMSVNESNEVDAGQWQLIGSTSDFGTEVKVFNTWIPAERRLPGKKRPLFVLRAARARIRFRSPSIIFRHRFRPAEYVRFARAALCVSVMGGHMKLSLDTKI